MAYINERLPKEERITYDLGYGRTKTPKYVTIDRDKNFLLFHDYTEIDEPVNQHFVFVYKNQVITMVLDGSEFADPDTKIWKIRGIIIPDELSKEEVLSELREALKVYGCFGTPPSMEYGNDYEKAITDF